MQNHRIKEWPQVGRDFKHHLVPNPVWSDRRGCPDPGSAPAPGLVELHEPYELHVLSLSRWQLISMILNGLIHHTH